MILSFPSTTTVGPGLANGGVVEIYIIPTDNTSITFSIADATVNQNGESVVEGEAVAAL